MSSRRPRARPCARWELNVSPGFAADAGGTSSAFRAMADVAPVAVPVIVLQSQAVVAHDTSERLRRHHGADARRARDGRPDAAAWPTPAAGEAIPGARLELLEDVGHLFWWEQPERSRRARARPRAARAREPDGASVQRGGQAPAARLARERVLDAELVERADDDAAHVVRCRRPSGSASSSRSSARSRSPASSAAKASPRSTSSARSSRMRAARPSALEAPGAPSTSRSASSSSPRRCSSRGQARRRRRRVCGWSSSARRSEASSPGSTRRSASEGTRPSKKRSTCARRLRADELVDDAAVLERLDGRDALDAEGLRDARVGVRVELGQHDLAARGPGPPARARREQPARAAPRGPEVDDDRDALRALDHLGLERVLGDVDDGMARR